jgi:hypothetical protein
VRKATRAKHPHRLYNIVLRITGKEKNRILKSAKNAQLNLSDYIKYCIYTEQRREQGFPTPEKTLHPMPNIQEQIKAIATGAEQAQPCGELACVQAVVEVASMKFCETCNLRVG